MAKTATWMTWTLMHCLFLLQVSHEAAVCPSWCRYATRLEVDELMVELEPIELVFQTANQSVIFLKTDVIGYLKNVTTSTNQLLNQPIWVFSVLNDVKWIEMLSITGCSPDPLFTQLFQALLKGIWVLASLAMNKSSRLSWKFWIPKMQGQK